MSKNKLMENGIVELTPYHDTVPLSKPYMESGKKSKAKSLLLVTLLAIFFLVVTAVSMYGIARNGSSSLSQYQQALDASQIDAVENVQLLNSVITNQTTNALANIPVEQTRTANDIAVKLAEAEASVIEIEAKSQAEINEAEAKAEAEVSISKAETALLMAQAEMVMLQAKADRDKILFTALMIWVPLAFLCMLFLVFLVLQQRDRSKLNKEMNTGSPPPPPPMSQLSANYPVNIPINTINEAEMVMNESSGAVHGRVVPHLDMLRDVGEVSEENIRLLPLRRIKHPREVPSWAILAIMRLKRANKNDALLSNIFGIYGSKYWIYTDIVSDPTRWIEEQKEECVE